MQETNTSTSVVTLVINGEGAKTSLKQLGSALNTVKKELWDLKEADNPAQYQQLLAQKKALTAEYIKQKTAVGDLRTSFSKYMNEVKTIMTGVMGGNFATWITTTLASAIPQAIDKIIKKRDQLADIERTTNLSASQVRALDKDLKNLYTRTSQGDLRGMASVAGQFNVAKDEITGFVEGVDKAAVALKELGGAEQTATTLGKLNNVFKDIEGTNIGDRITHIANALNVLEASGVATAPVISDFSARIGRALVPLQVGSDKIMGMSAAMEEMNLSAELGSTAVIEAFQRMLTETDTFARISGMKLDDYKNLIQKDIYGAFLKYLEGLQRVKGNQLEFTAALEASKLSGSGAMQTIGAMVENYDLLKDKINIAGKALKNTDSIQDEFNKKNYALAVNLKKLGEFFVGLYTSSGLESFIEMTVEGTARLFGLIDEVKEATSAYEKQANSVKRLEKDLVPLLNRQEQLKNMAKQLGGVSKLTADMQVELKENIKQVAEIVPEAVTQFDNYGNAMDINTGKARKAIEIQKELLKFYNRAAIEETRTELRRVQGQRIGNIQQLNSKTRRQQMVGAGGSMMIEQPLTSGELQALQSQVDKQNEEEARLLRLLEGFGENPYDYMLPDNKRRNATPSRDGLRGSATPKTNSPAPPPTGSGGFDFEKDKKGKSKKDKPITPGIPFDTWQEAIEAEKEAWNKIFEEVEKEKKEAAERAAALDKELMDETLFELEMRYEEERFQLEIGRAKELMTEEEFQEKKSELEKTYSLARMVVRQSHGEQILDEQRKLNDLLIEDEQRKTDALIEMRKAEEQYDKEQAEKKKEYAQLNQQATHEIIDGVSATISSLKSAAKEGGKMYKAMVVAEKAWAIASTIMNAQQEISNYWKLYSPIPGGQVIAGILTGVAVARSIASIAKIASTDVPDVTFREKGGWMGRDIESAGGYHTQPTMLNYGGRKFAIAEKVPEFVISGAAMQYAPVANFAAMLDSLQRGGNLSALNNIGRGGGGGTDLAPLMGVMLGIREELRAVANRPVVFNYDKFRDFEDFLLEIEKNTSA